MIELISNSPVNELFQTEFELINSGFMKGEENMKFDYERTMAVAKGEEKPMFRLYAWDPWAVSLGYNQKLEDISEEAAHERGIDVVRRPTGGRAVLHATELTYSVVMNVPEGQTIHDLYRDIHVILVEGLREVGAVELGFEKAQADFKEFYNREDGSQVSCFASSARYEIEWNKRKIVGSAQRLFGNTLLQHGSILLGEGHEQLAYVANIKSEVKRKFLLEYTARHSATIADVIGREVGFEEASEAMAKVVSGKNGQFSLK